MTGEGGTVVAENGLIYCVTHKESGRKYVGQTISTLYKVKII